MARLATVILLVTIPIIMFGLAGLIPKEDSYLLNNMNIFSPEDVGSESNPIFKSIGIVVALGLVGAVVAGTFFGRNVDTILFGAVTAALGGVIVAIIKDYIVLANVLGTVTPALSVLVISPILLISGFFLIEWWLKKD